MRKTKVKVAGREGLKSNDARRWQSDPHLRVSMQYLRAILDSAAAGPAWDRAYLDLTIAAHEASLENLARAYAATKSPELKKYIDRSAPIVQKHLEKAKRLQKPATKTDAR